MSWSKDTACQGEVEGVGVAATAGARTAEERAGQGGGGGDLHVHIHTGVLIGDEFEARMFGRQMKTQLDKLATGA